METLDWKFIFSIITFAFIGLICLLKKSKIGLTASSLGVIGALIIWAFFKMGLKLKSFLGEFGLGFKDVFNFLGLGILTIICFFILFFLLKGIKNIKGSSYKGKKKKR